MKEENNHKIGFILPKSSRYCMGVTVCIDRERINAMGLFPTDKKRTKTISRTNDGYGMEHNRIRGCEH